MDPLEARLKCLELALDLPQNTEATVERAKKYAEFVIGDPVKSSASFGKKGADDPVKS